MENFSGVFQTFNGSKFGQARCEAGRSLLRSPKKTKLQGLFNLALQYTKDYHTTMVPENTKILCYTPRGQELDIQYWELVSPINMKGLKISISKDADHVARASLGVQNSDKV